MDRITVSDRRRVNAPKGGTEPVEFKASSGSSERIQSYRPYRNRASNELRKICELLPSRNAHSDTDKYTFQS
jgi:hypothetical protein